MGAAKKWNEQKREIPAFQIIKGGKTDNIYQQMPVENRPAEDYLVFHAYDDVKSFFQFLPIHLSIWAHQSQKQMDALNKERDKNLEDYRYWNYF